MKMIDLPSYFKLDAIMKRNTANSSYSYKGAQSYTICVAYV